jgi:hypothetical protein
MPWKAVLSWSLRAAGEEGAELRSEQLVRRAGPKNHRFDFAV